MHLTHLNTTSYAEHKALDSVSHLTDLRSTIDAERSVFQSEMQNIIDEIIGLINQTLYLLTLT
jgi:hypothetical protein